MCVGIPAQVVEILAAEKKSAIVEVESVRREVSIVVVLDDGVKVGDWVLLHVGFAMSIIDEEEAAAQLEFMRLLGSVYDEEVEAFASVVPLTEIAGAEVPSAATPDTES
jgi:hydrogenase expression/formation protein HypC